MSIRKRRTAENLVLGDYVTVHVPGIKANPKGMGAACDILVRHEDFFQRIDKKLGELKGARNRVAA